MTSLALIFTLSAIGISETVYLIRKRTAAEKPVCFLGENCHVVLTSKYSKLFFIPNDILGLIAYIIISTISAFLVVGIEPVALWNLVLKALITLASLTSLLFTYLQWRVIKAWCFWCIFSASTIWLMGLIIIVSSII